VPSVIEYVIKHVEAKAYWEWVYADDGGIKWPSGSVEPRLKSPLRADTNPSFTVNKDTGAWFDHGSDDGGNHIVSFHAEWQGVTLEEAAKEIYAQFIHPVIPSERVAGWAASLKKTPSLVGYLTGKRLIVPRIIQQFEIGVSGDRYTIPIRNEFGSFINAKLYKPGGKPKMLNYKVPEEIRSYGSPAMLYPLSVLEHTPDEEPIVVCEGEWDVLALLSLGIMAVTSTCGAKSWPRQYNELFRNRRVVVAYDNDEDGEKYDKRVVNELSKLAKTIRRLYIPKLPKVKDVTDWMHARTEMRTPAGWQKAIAGASVLINNPDAYIAKQQTTEIISLDQASKAIFTGKRIQVDALITGKDTSPYILPKKFRVTCSKECDECPLAASGKPHRDKELDTKSPQVLELVNVPKAVMKRALLTIAGMPSKPTCQSKCDIVETFNVENVFAIPSLSSRNAQYVMQSSWYVGHGLKSNRTYRLTGTTLADPQDQHATQLFDEARPVQDEVETFSLTDEAIEDLQRFKIKQGGKSDDVRRVLIKLQHIAEWQSRNLTKIRQRDDLHTAVDLVFHSVAAFNFNGELISRGMLDVLILGDTRCGKGYVTNGLSRHYQLGEIASGENCSFAGLVGGCENIGKRFIVKWGIIPLNNGRLVVIDEASALSEQDFGKLSRVRSEGVAEISKIVREQTQANTRLLWLSNTRSGRPIMSYNSGVQAVKELIGANEDISRFDFAMAVATNEVDTEIINAISAHDDTDDAAKYPAHACRALVLWAWSRTPDQIEFTKAATAATIKTAIEFGKAYNSSIPLIQSENVE
jgi:5S rRNA maturation endonuclease (ribonuclease M5)